jgi:HlyD family secretion protein
MMFQIRAVAVSSLLPLLAACDSPAVPTPPADPATQPAPRVAGALGRIEPAQGVVKVGAMPGERIEKLLVSGGDVVAAGDQLARLAGDELRSVEYEAARLQLKEAGVRAAAQKRMAATTLAEAELGLEEAATADLEVAAQQARVEATRQAVDVARSELERLAGLEPRLVPAQALARKRLAVTQAELELQMQEAALERLVAATSLRRRAAAARMESARANVAVVEAASSLEPLEKAVEAARLRRDGSLVRAPLAGRVIDIGTRAGEIVGPRPILRLADVSRLQVVAEVYETDVRRIRLGQRAEARSQAIDGTLTGRVVSIGTLVAPHDVQELGMPATAERRVVDVRIDLDDPAAAAALIHLQVDVDFLADGEAEPARAGVAP